MLSQDGLTPLQSFVAVVLFLSVLHTAFATVMRPKSSSLIAGQSL